MGHLGNLTNYLCLRLKFEKKRCFPFNNTLLFPLPAQHNVENQKEVQVLIFKIVCGARGVIRQVKLYSRLACEQKCQKCKFVSRVLSIIVHSLLHLCKLKLFHNRRYSMEVTSTCKTSYLLILILYMLLLLPVNHFFCDLNFPCGC